MPTFLHFLITSSLTCSSSLTMLCTSPFFTPSSSLHFTFRFLVSSFSNLHFYMWCGKYWFNKDCWFSLKPLPSHFSKETNNIFLDWTTLWGGSLSHKCLVEHIFWSCIHSHRTITKITLGKQKRMTRGNLIASSNYSNSQSPEGCQETQYQRCILAQLVQRGPCFSVWWLIF